MRSTSEMEAKKKDGKKKITQSENGVVILI